ncbi:MAG: transcriptional repressor [Planctomycetes bacterium]|nr:transcriptional repressor [Planctomycetota bacterium]
MERQTNQRNAIRDAFETAARPLGPQEALATAQAKVPRLGIATVYRTIKGLMDEGWLVAVALPGEPPRYELARKHNQHHHHFRCRVCEKVFDIEGCSGEIESHVPPGFKVESHTVVIYGLCPDCSGAAAPAAKSPRRSKS